MSRLSLRLLGTFQATLDGRPVKGFDSDRVRALLAYLSVEADRPHRRERLAGLLWPEQPEQVARSNLRYALSNLRGVIGDRTASPPFLRITRHTLQLNPEGDTWVDVAAFVRHLSLAEGAPDSASVAHLEEAVALYRGDFMAGFSLTHSVLFEEWVLFTREALAWKAANALRRLMACAQQRGDLQAAQNHARRLLQLEPWQEEVHQALMRLLALDGQRAAALAQYETCRRVLAEELGVEPLPETVALYERIRAGALEEEAARLHRPPVTFSMARLAPGLTATSQPFVARDDELNRMHRVLAEVLSGEGRVMFVTGEAGSGKTALIRRFVEQAMARHTGLVAAYGRCDAFTGAGDPYLPFREILQTLTGDIETRRAGGEIEAEHARRLWAIWPEAIRVLLEAGPDLVDLFVPGDVLAYRAEMFLQTDGMADWVGRRVALARQRAASDGVQPPQRNIFQQVARVLQTLSDYCPLVLVLDDLQWADNTSLDLLFHLSRGLTGHRILVLGAYRSTDVASGGDARSPLPAVVHEIERLFGNCRLDLDRADGRQLVEAYLDTIPNRLGATFRETFLRHTGGNPLFVVELLSSLQAGGSLVRDESGRWVEAESIRWQRLPARVEAVIAERIGRLPSAWQALLRVAAVEGEAFTAEVVARVRGETPRKIIRTLSEDLGRRHRLVRPTRLQWSEHGVPRLSRYRFRHSLFQRYLYDRLDEPERAALHRAVGEALEHLYADAKLETAEIWPRLAYHFEAAGVPDKAVGYLLKAGERAAQMSAYGEAMTLFSRGLALLEALPDTPERAQQELELRLALSGPLLVMRGWGADERARAAARVIELCRRAGDETQLLRALFLQADMLRAIGHHREALPVAEQYLDLAQASQAPAQIGLAHWSLGETHFLMGNLTAARRHMERVVALYDARQNRALLALTGVDPTVASSSWLAWTLWMLGYPEQALAYSEKALAAARDLDHPLSTVFALTFAGCGLGHLCRRPQAVEEALRAMAQFTDDEIASMRAWRRVFQGWASVTRGQVEEGIEALRAGMEAWRAMKAVSGLSYQSLLLIEAYARSGRVEDGLSLAAQVLAGMEETDERLVEAEVHRLRGELERLRGRQAEAEACFLEAIEVARRQQARSWEMRATMSLAALWRRTAKRRRARAMLLDLYTRFTEGLETPDLQEAGRLLRALRS